MLALALAVLFQAATAAPALPTGPITDPMWEPLRVPYTETYKYYPQAALEHGIDGAAIVECQVQPSGALADCKALREAPEGQGFGASAASIAGLFRMKPTTQSGASVGGRTVKLPIRFRLPWSPEDAIDSKAVFTVMGQTIFVAKPTGYDIARYYPERAQRRNIEGFATIRCRVTPQGTMGGCTIAAQGPADENFGDAALRLAPLFRIDMTKGAGLVAEGKEFSIPIRFRLPRG